VGALKPGRNGGGTREGGVKEGPFQTNTSKPGAERKKSRVLVTAKPIVGDWGGGSGWGEKRRDSEIVKHREIPLGKAQRLDPPGENPKAPRGAC